MQTSPDKYLQGLNPKHIEDVFDNDVPTIAMVVNECGQNTALAVLIILISDMLKFFNVDNTMTAQQVGVTAELLIEEYPYLKVDDFKLVFKRAMRGKYGKVYNRLDGQIIFGWLATYIRERAYIADDISYNEAKRQKAASESEGVFYEDYRRELERKAADGDEEAREKLRMSSDVGKIFSKWNEEKLKDKLDGYERWKESQNGG